MTMAEEIEQQAPEEEKKPDGKHKKPPGKAIFSPHEACPVIAKRKKEGNQGGECA
jgi:hypothetical protein